MPKPLITAIIPNYKTPELTRICLRALVKYSDLDELRVIVVDNHSNDESVRYLRSLKWIRLIERDTAGESGPEMHAKALDLAMREVTTDFVLVMHTDTIVLRRDWLHFLFGHLDAKSGGVGSWKLESVSPWKAAGKKIENAVRRLLGRKILDREHYFRSHLALYRTEAVRRTTGFFDGETAGMRLFQQIREQGYDMPFIPSEDLQKYVCHLNHATMILNPREGDRKTASPAARRALKRKLDRLGIGSLLNDESLDLL